MGIPLQIAKPTGQYERMLRRFVFGNTSSCPEGSYHNVDVIIERVPEEERLATNGDLWPHDDERWPTECACGYIFTEDDQWQLNHNRICRLPDGSEFAFWGSFGRCAPPGTMIRAEWYDEYTKKQFTLSELTESWLIALPDGGEWITTQQATGGGFWTVTGIPPNITATPSIWHSKPNGWHGFVTNGELVNA